MPSLKAVAASTTTNPLTALHLYIDKSRRHIRWKEGLIALMWSLAHQTLLSLLSPGEENRMDSFSWERKRILVSLSPKRGVLFYHPLGVCKWLLKDLLLAKPQRRRKNGSLVDWKREKEDSQPLFQLSHPLSLPGFSDRWLKMVPRGLSGLMKSFLSVSLFPINPSLSSDSLALLNSREAVRHWHLLMRTSHYFTKKRFLLERHF